MIWILGPLRLGRWRIDAVFEIDGRSPGLGVVLDREQRPFNILVVMLGFLHFSVGVWKEP